MIKARHARGEDAAGALAGLIPFLSYWYVIVAYLFLQPKILHNHLIPFVLYVGLVNAYSVGQIITAHLTLSEFPMQNILSMPLMFGVFDSLGPYLTKNSPLADYFGPEAFGWPTVLSDGEYQVYYVYMLLGLAVGVYGSFVVEVIFTICDYLGIWCLTIKHPVPQEGGEGAAKKQQ